MTLTGIDGRKLTVTHNAESDLPIVVRDGQKRDWDRYDLYRSVGASSPMSLGWKKGTLRIEAGGHVFEQTVTPGGKVTFSEK